MRGFFRNPRRVLIVVKDVWSGCHARFSEVFWYSEDFSPKNRTRFTRRVARGGMVSVCIFPCDFSADSISRDSMRCAFQFSQRIYLACRLGGTLWNHRHFDEKQTE
jgi:hypothetical protein